VIEPEARPAADVPSVIVPLSTNVRGGATVNVSEPVTPAYVAAISTCPACTPLTIPEEDTVATEVFDAAGLEALSRIREQGAMITGAPTYIQLRLDSISRKSRPSRA